MQEYSIGRESSNQIILKDNFVSRRHAELIISDNGEVLLRDLGSSNGTFVNDKRINECFLKQGDIVKCGSVFLNWSHYIPDNSLRPSRAFKPYSEQVENKADPHQTWNNRHIHPGTPVSSKTDITKKMIVIIAAVLLVLSFFLPWFKIFVNISAWDILFGGVGGMIDSEFKYLALIIPVSGAIIFFSAAFHEEKYPISKKLLFSLPVFTLIVVGIILAYKITGMSGSISDSAMKTFFEIMGVGFWLTLICSLGLEILGQNSTTEKKIPNSKINYNSKSITGLIIAVVGISLLIYSQSGNFTKTRTYDSYDINKQMGLPDAFNMHMLSSETSLDTNKKNKILYSGLIFLFIGGFIFIVNDPPKNTHSGEI